jgi:SAM-dependent methyltransferase
MKLEAFELFAEDYDRWYDENPYLFQSELKALKKVTPDGVGLEVGVGTGRFAKELGVEFGVDPAINMLRFAKERGIKVVAGVGEQLPFVNDVFDFVINVITICFVEDPKAVLSESKRVLKRGGRLIIGFIDRNSFLGKIYEEKKKMGHKFYKYANFFAPVEIVELMKEEEFSNFEIYQTIFSIESSRRVEEPKEGFGKGAFVVISGVKE